MSFLPDNHYEIFIDSSLYCVLYRSKFPVLPWIINHISCHRVTLYQTDTAFKFSCFPYFYFLKQGHLNSTNSSTQKIYIFIETWTMQQITELSAILTFKLGKPRRVCSAGLSMLNPLYCYYFLSKTR